MVKLGRRSYSVRLGRCGRVRCEPGWSMGPAWADGLRDDDLFFVWAGRGRMRLSGEEIALYPGVAVWMRPGGRYEADHESGAPLGVSFVHFDMLDAKDRIAVTRHR